MSETIGGLEQKIRKLLLARSDGHAVEAWAALDELLRLLREVREERDEAMQGLWHCFVAAGCDPDGNTKWHTEPSDAARYTVDAVAELRREYENLLDETA